MHPTQHQNDSMRRNALHRQRLEEGISGKKQTTTNNSGSGITAAAAAAAAAAGDAQLSGIKHVLNNKEEEKHLSAAATTTTTKLKKHPGAPKRFRTAFIIFSQERHGELRSRLRDQGSDIDTINIARMVSDEWREMTLEQKEKWEEMARQDKDRYLKEKEEYVGPWKVPADMKKPKDPTAPKKPTPAYFSFSNERRQTVKKEHPTASNGEISKMLSKMWKEVDDETRQIYVAKEKKERDAYNIAVLEWKKKKKESGKEHWWDNEQNETNDSKGKGPSKKRRLSPSQLEDSDKSSVPRAPKALMSQQSLHDHLANLPGGPHSLSTLLPGIGGAIGQQFPTSKTPSPNPNDLGGHTQGLDFNKPGNQEQNSSILEQLRLLVNQQQQQQQQQQQPSQASLLASILGGLREKQQQQQQQPEPASINELLMSQLLQQQQQQQQSQISQESQALQSLLQQRAGSNLLAQLQAQSRTDTNLGDQNPLLTALLAQQFSHNGSNGINGGGVGFNLPQSDPIPTPPQQSQSNTASSMLLQRLLQQQQQQQRGNGTPQQAQEQDPQASLRDVLARLAGGNSSNMNGGS